MCEIYSKVAVILIENVRHSCNQTIISLEITFSAIFENLRSAFTCVCNVRNGNSRVFWEKFWICRTYVTIKGLAMQQ